MKRWRRPLMLIALLLLAGAMVNVAVAWGIAAVSSGSSGEFAQVESESWLVATPPDWDAPSYTGFYDGPGWRKFFQGRRVELPYQEVRILESGFPRPSARTWRVLLHRPDSRPRQVNIVSASGLRAPEYFVSRGYFESTAGLLPTEPVPAGFAINTLFYAAILALPLSVFPIRRRLRARLGRCPKCGYDLAGLRGVAQKAGKGGAKPGGEGAAPCPECGATR